MQAYIVTPELVIETHTKQEIDSDGYYLWKQCFGNFDSKIPVARIVDQMLMKRYSAVIANACRVGIKRFNDFK